MKQPKDELSASQKEVLEQIHEENIQRDLEADDEKVRLSQR